MLIRDVCPHGQSPVDVHAPAVTSGLPGIAVLIDQGIDLRIQAGGYCSPRSRYSTVSGLSRGKGVNPRLEFAYRAGVPIAGAGQAARHPSPAPQAGRAPQRRSLCQQRRLDGPAQPAWPASP